MNINQAPLDLHETTKIFWEQRLGRSVSQEETREMIENVTGIFLLLSQWDTIERERTNTGDLPNCGQ